MFKHQANGLMSRQNKIGSVDFQAKQPVTISDISYLHNRTEEQRRQPCVTSMTIIFVSNNFHQTFTFLKTDLFVKDQKTLLLIKDHSKTHT